MTKQSWLKLPTETPRMYEIFQYFLSLPVEKRTIQAVANYFTVSTAYIKQLIAKNQWRQRAADFENSKTEAIQKGATKAAEKVAFDWAAWDLENLEKIRLITDKMFGKTLDIMNLPLVQREHKENLVKDKEGNPVLGPDDKPIYQNVTILNPMKFTGSDAAKFAEAAILMSNYVIERNKSYLPNGFNQHLPAAEKDLDEMSPDELMEYAEQCRLASERIAKGEPIDITPLEQ